MTPEAHLVIEVGKLSVRPQGPATAGIWLTLGESHFPMIGWNDFVVVVLGWWVAAVLRVLQSDNGSERINFMDGPYAVDLSKMRSEKFHLRMFAGPNGGHDVAVGEAGVRPFIVELLTQSQNLLDECRSRGWWSLDAEELQMRLRNLGRALDENDKG